VSIPPAPLDPGPTSILVDLFHQVHAQIRDELAGLTDMEINWTPISGANSIGTIITHLVGSEAETLCCVAGVECDRDRHAEFIADPLTMRQVLVLLDGADDLVTVLEPLIDSARLQANITLPTLPNDEIRRGLTWLIGNYGHAREHLGHIQLTKQLRQCEKQSAILGQS
jgi:hypothetical protein